MIKKLLGAVAMALTCTTALAAGGDFPLERAPKQVNDLASLQNGAKLFVNHCLNCHSANSMRYNKLAEIGLSDEQIRDNLLFTGERVGDMMRIAMQPADAGKWFGTAPPDLSVIARAKSINAGPSGADYIYTYLRTFYRDASKATGWDNLVFPNVGMPHVMWNDQGPRELTRTEVRQAKAQDGSTGWERVVTTYDAQGYASVQREPLAGYKGHGSVEHRFKALDPARASRYEQEVADLTNFLNWMAEPAQLQRKRLGVWVLIFLGLFLVVAWRLNASFWKHVK
ncbi:cytochrome c1 [Orrella sp. JC864]|uniref:cytochrome c1 n=1 Tax=Orrella sp. JC864 TaxID=3120298 RepID=UPI0012BBEFDF